MDILSALKFVQGSVARKDYDPSLTHFKISGGTVRGYNGIIGLCCTIPLSLDVVPKAVPFIKAIQACQDVVNVSMTPNGRLSIRSGTFRSYVECLDEKEFPDISPEGTFVSLEGVDFLGALEAVSPFIAEDASRPWARGVLFRGQSVLATNNIIVVEHWMPVAFPMEVNVPEEAVSELLRIKTKPTGFRITESNITFEYEDGSWLKSRLYATTWPDVSRVLDRPSTQTPLDVNLKKVLDRLRPFVGKLEAVYFRDGVVTTSLEENTGASEDLHVCPDGCFNIYQLLALCDIAESVDFTQYPAPCLFYGGTLRGAIVGMRV